jgi:pimeloyl-ACP methyl ester carboxylesterase
LIRVVDLSVSKEAPNIQKDAGREMDWQTIQQTLYCVRITCRRFARLHEHRRTTILMDQIGFIRLASGRRVAVHSLAKGNGQRTIVLCHPAPGAGNFDPDPEATAKRQITMIAVDRPGYGSSDPVTGNEWASVASAAGDLIEVLQHLQLDRVGVVGWSAGGRVALALAARRPDLVDRVAILATPAPDEMVPWIPEEQWQNLKALRDLPPSEVHGRLVAQLDGYLPTESPAESLLTMLGRSPADDEALTRPGAIDRLTQMLEAAFIQGTIGLAADIAGYCLCPWGFKAADVQAKVLCLYGSRDPIAGSRHGNWWQKNLPNARLEMVPGIGHLLMLSMWPRVLSFLAPRKG